MSTERLGKNRPPAVTATKRPCRRRAAVKSESPAHQTPRNRQQRTLSGAPGDALATAVEFFSAAEAPRIPDAAVSLGLSRTCSTTGCGQRQVVMLTTPVIGRIVVAWGGRGRAAVGPFGNDNGRRRCRLDRGTQLRDRYPETAVYGLRGCDYSTSQAGQGWPVADRARKCLIRASSERWQELAHHGGGWPVPMASTGEMWELNSTPQVASLHNREISWSSGSEFRLSAPRVTTLLRPREPT